MLFRSTLGDLHACLVSLKNQTYMNEIRVDEQTRMWAKVALERMFEV